MTTSQQLTVENGKVVQIDYTLRLEDQEIVDTSEGSEPLEFILGQGQIIAGLEEALRGMTVGDERKVVVAPADAYGDHDPEAYQLVNRDLFPADIELSQGMGFQMRDGETGEIVLASIAEIRSEKVLLDLNHPLAGEILHFDVNVVGIRDATSEEIEHGHIHGKDHE